MILFFFQELSSESSNVAIVGSAFEVAHEFSLEPGQIQGNSGECFCPADKVPNSQPRTLLDTVKARLVKSKWYITCDKEHAYDFVLEFSLVMQTLVSRQYARGNVCAHHHSFTREN